MLKEFQTTFKNSEMRKIQVITAVYILTCMSALAQIKRPTIWSYAAKKVSAHEAIIYVKANLQPGWHIYSLNQPEGGPEKTIITLETSKSYAPVKKFSEPKPITKYEEVFEMNVAYFEKTVIFQQRVRFSKLPITVKGKVRFMVCTEKECLPSEEIEFSIPINNTAD